MTAPFSRTLIDLVREQAARVPDATALVCPQGRFSYQDLALRAERVAGALWTSGVRRGDRVGLLMSNCVEWVDVCLGAGAIGAVTVPLSTWSTRAELATLLQDAHLALLVAVGRFNESDFEADLQVLRDTPNMPAADRIWLVGGEGTHFPRYATMLESANVLATLAPGEGPCAGDDALILYTSGSTSAPKAVPLRQFAVIENGFNIGERQGLTSKDRVLLSAPLFWAFGGANALPATFTHGATLVLMEKFDPAQALELIEEERCSAIYTLPAMTAALVRHPNYRPQMLATLRTGVTIGSAEDFLFAVEKLGAAELCNIYGATETCGNCAVTWHHWPLLRRAHCQGPPLPGQQIRFVDELSGLPVQPGTPGLAEVRGYTTLGYSGASADQNTKAFTPDGFYRTGDMGLLNDDGDFVFVGRVSEMIKRAGINVSPAEVEEVLRRHSSVQDAAVVGVPDADRGERIFAFVVPTAWDTFDAAVLMRHCATEASKYKLPDHIESCVSLPLTVTGKLQRSELKKLALKRVAELAASAPKS
ncbi:MAG: class I adenylate-forming enzyme family protein [Burkholderiaceae bacterium]|nr:class I adenylate-forming enzyme family protein [Burkholderiaceae bacterium]